MSDSSAPPHGEDQPQPQPLDAGDALFHDTTAPPPPPPLERRGRGARRVAWAGARARNALRYPGKLLGVATAVFIIVIATLVLVPRQAQRAFAALLPRPDEWRDTAAVVDELVRVRAEHADALQEFAEAREAATAPLPAPPPPAVVLSAEQIRQRDSLELVVAALDRGLQRVERSPLPATYRALGELPELAGEPRVRLLLDSLALVEREREEFAALGGVDPIYVALTTRANAIGRSIQEIADRRRSSARAQIAALEPPPPPPPPRIERPQVDTITPMNRVLAAQRQLAATEQRLSEAQRVNAELRQREQAARAGANFIAPPLAVFVAAVVLALAVGYAVVLLYEMIRPRVADAAEVERETGKRVLGVVRSEAPTPERMRRRADVRTPELLDPLAQPYRMLYLHISPTGQALPIVTVTGDDPDIVATVSANLAAAAAEDARSPLLLDADLANGGVARAMRVRPAPGIAELLADEATWSESIASAVFGRERVVDVIPAGRHPSRWTEPAPSDEFRMSLSRMARRYDLTVVAAPIDHACRGARSILPAPDVILCIRATVTTTARLRQSIAALESAGLRVQGVLLWDADAPAIEAHGDSMPVPRRERETAEV